MPGCILSFARVADPRQGGARTYELRKRDTSTAGTSFQMIETRPSSQRSDGASSPGHRRAYSRGCRILKRSGSRRGGLPVIRDAETEQLLRDYTQPILRAAGLAQQNIHPVIINDRSFNAFVIDAKRIFVNAGALIDSKTPNQIIGVMAHESGHIAGGHLSKLRAELANAQTAAILAMLLGLGAAMAGAPQRQRGRRRGDGGRDGPAVGDDDAALVLPAPAGRAGRQGRREIPQRHRPERQGHVRNLQALLGRSSSTARRGPRLTCARTRCRKSAWRR